MLCGQPPTRQVFTNSKVRCTRVSISADSSLAIGGIDRSGDITLLNGVEVSEPAQIIAPRAERIVIELRTRARRRCEVGGD